MPQFPLNALQGLFSRPRLTRSPLEGEGISENVYEADPSLSLPIVAETQAGQPGLDALRAQLGPGPQFQEQANAVADTRKQQRQAYLGGFESPQAQAQFGRGVGPEYERVQEQKRQDLVAGAGATLHPDVQRVQETTAQRGAYPAEAQAKGLELQALFGLQGRQATASGTVEAARSRRDAAAMQYLQRSVDELMSREDLRNEDKALLQDDT